MFKRNCMIACYLFCIFCSNEISAASNSTSPKKNSCYYIVFNFDQSNNIEPVFFEEVEVEKECLDFSISKSNIEALKTASIPRHLKSIKWTLKNSRNEVFDNASFLSLWERAEFGSHKKWLPVKKKVFVVKIPKKDSESILFNDFGIEFNLKKLKRRNYDVLSPESFELIEGGTSSNRVNVLVIGDGYRNAEMDKFLSDAEAAKEQFFSISPHNDYSNFVNFNFLFVPSKDSGADHPPYQAGCSSFDANCCADSDALSDPLTGSFVSTAFDSSFCINNIHRLLIPDRNKVFAAAAKYPDWNQIIIIVNDPVYGGSGGAFSTVSLNENAKFIVNHEYGHSFAGLADEYENPYPGYPPCSDLDNLSTPCEANVTNEYRRNLIKWKGWIQSDVPIPTPENDPTYNFNVGLFEGARYLALEMFRPGNACIMRDSRAPYCSVPTEAYIRKLYEGSWGGSAGIDLIEPGTEDPLNDSIQVLTLDELSFSADILKPNSTHPLKVIWFLDGNIEKEVNQPETTESFSFVPIPGKQYEVKLVVQDLTALLLSPVEKAHTWNIHAPEQIGFLQQSAIIREDHGSFLVGIQKKYKTSDEASVHVDVVASGGASNGVDFEVISDKQIYWGNGESEVKYIEVEIINDLLEEDYIESFTLELNQAQGGIVDPVKSRIIIRIVDEDALHPVGSVNMLMYYIVLLVFFLYFYRARLQSK